MTTTLGPSAPLDVLVVASWYPSIDDVGAGRFVADQVVSLARSGRVSPRVVSFDPVRLVGGASSRADQLSVVEHAFGAAVAVEARLFAPHGHAVDAPVPVSRLSIAAGTVPHLGATAAVHHRVAALEALASRLRLDAGPIPDLLHAHTGFPDGAAAAALAAWLDRPLIITEHATFLERILADPDQRAAYVDACRRAARVVAVGELLAGRMRNALPEVADRIVVIPNAIAVEAFESVPLERRTPDELLFVGYRKEIKGIDTLLRAFALVRATRPAARLRLIGRAPTDALERRWRNLAAQLDVAAAVDFEDVTDRLGVAAAMARASVFVHASRYETFGVVAAEALAAGLPIVATDSGGVAEILGPSPERLGALVAVGDPDAFAAAVIETLERRASFSPGDLRAAVVERYGGEVVARRLAALYAEVIAERHVLGSPEVSSSRSPAPPPADAVPRRTVVLGLDRTATAARLTRISPEVRATLRVITASEPRSVTLPALGHVRNVPVPPVPSPARVRDGGTATSARLRRLFSDPAGTMRDRIGQGPLSPAALDAATALVGAALTEYDDAAVAIVPLDGRDVLVAERLVTGTAAVIAAGGLRRIGDVASIRAGEADADGEPEAEAD